MLADTTKRDIQRESTNPYCVMIPSFHGIISSFHAVFVLRHRDKSAKAIDYNDQVIRVRECLLLLGIPSPMFFLSCSSLLNHQMSISGDGKSLDEMKNRLRD